ncbi:hypothetical protein AK830_g5657 [Neonectria ditissima]|uniref:Uncharacterized protein n=1 Tax=Neonectria ditissima TaxID=78410 RepID=A0A0P7BKM9_9HYPO|nr:hypothetical protein AK830_g5657 [Neonectria ditissima]
MELPTAHPSISHVNSTAAQAREEDGCLLPGRHSGFASTFHARRIFCQSSHALPLAQAQPAQAFQGSSLGRASSLLLPRASSPRAINHVPFSPRHRPGAQGSRRRYLLLHNLLHIHPHPHPHPQSTSSPAPAPTPSACVSLRAYYVQPTTILTVLPLLTRATTNTNAASAHFLPVPFSASNSHPSTSAVNVAAVPPSPPIAARLAVPTSRDARPPSLPALLTRFLEAGRLPRRPACFRQARDMSRPTIPRGHSRSLLPLPRWAPRTRTSR